MGKRVALPNISPRDARVDFQTEKYDIVIDQKGYNVLWERMLICPCKKELTDSAISDCVNCNGTGYFYITGVQTKAILTNAMMQKNFSQQWSEVLQGTVNATVMSDIKIGWMDSFTVLDAESVYTQVRKVKANLTDKIIDLTYTPTKILGCYKFISESADHLLIDIDLLTISTLNGRPILVLPSSLSVGDDLTVLYEYNPVYLVIDIMNDYRNTRTQIKDIKQTVEKMPLRALLKKKHLVAL